MLSLILAFLRPALDFGGIAGGITDIIGGAGLPHPGYYTPGGTQQADAAFMQALNAISAATNRNTGQIDPVLLHSYSQMLGIDLSGLISGGQAAGDAYKQMATAAGGYGTAAGDMGRQIQTTAFDPQGQLHDYLRQQTTDASRAADSARGTAMGPVSSGNESTALRNFELDWQNRQLGRQMAGGQSATGLFDASLGYMGAVPGATMAGARAPIAGQTAAYGAPMDFSTQFLGAENAMFQPQAAMATSMAQPYLQFGTQSGSNLYNQRLGRAMDQTQMIAGGFNSAFGGGAGDPSQWFGYGGGNPFSMSSWGGGGGGAGGLPTEQVLAGSAPGYYGGGAAGVAAAGML